MDLRIPKSVLIGVGVLLLVTAGIVVGVMTTAVLGEQQKSTQLTAADVSTAQEPAKTAPTSSRVSSPTPAPTVTKTETQTPAYVPVPVPVPERTKYVPQPYPAVASGSWHPIVTLEGSNVFVRSGPSTRSAPVGELSTGSSVNVVCYVTGETVSGNAFWNRVSGPYYGYVADRFVASTGSVPHC